MPKPTAKRVKRCKSCGCTENNCALCTELSGAPCSWVRDDLCSACVGLVVVFVRVQYGAYVARAGSGAHAKAASSTNAAKYAAAAAASKFFAAALKKGAKLTTIEKADAKNVPAGQTLFLCSPLGGFAT